MASTYSTNLALELIGTGDQAGTWGDTTNTNLGTLVEQAISGYVTQAITDGADTTITIPNGSTGVARNMYIECTGTLSANRNLVVPANKKLYFIYNNTSGGFAVTVKVSGQTGVSVPNGDKKILVSNGTDVVEATSYISTSAGSLTVTNLNVTSATITNLINTSATITGLTSTNGSITNVSATSLTVTNNATIDGIYVGQTRGTGTLTTVIGLSAGINMSTSTWTTLYGNNSGNNISTGGANTFVGYFSGSGVSTGSSNTAMGDTAYLSGNYSNSTCLGFNSSVTGSNQVQLGNSSTTTYAYGSVQDRSDSRDKADIQDTNLGTQFIMALQPRMFRWDYRDDYRPPMPEKPYTQEQWDEYQEACKLANLTHNGTHKRVRFHQGLIAQEVKQVMDQLGVDFGGYQDHSINGGDAILSIGYEELIPPLIKALQELRNEFDEYKANHP